MKMLTGKCTYCSQEDKPLFIAESIIYEHLEGEPSMPLEGEDVEIARAICIDCSRNISRTFQAVEKAAPQVLVGR